MVRMFPLILLAALPLAVLAAPRAVVRQTCHASGVRCAGAPGFPFVQWAPCCVATQQCLPSTGGDWGSRCQTPGGGGPTCYNTGERCQGAPGFPFVQWRPCCRAGDSCVQVTAANDWGFRCTGAGTMGPVTTTPRTTAPSSTTPRTTATTANDNCRGFRAERKEIMDMTDAEWNRYVGALETLRQSGVFARYVTYHNTYQNQAHRGCNFLPWHRQYLFEFERELNRVAPGVSIPYWDWTKRSPDSPTPVSQRFTHDPIWGRMGGAAGNAPIPNPPFRNWAPSGTPVIRDFRTGNGGVGGGGARYTFLSSQDVATLTNSIGEFGRFSDFLEANHGTPHVAVGGTMSGVPVSPGDPIFWSHHAFIDKIWQDWQNAGNGNAFGGIQNNPVRTCTLDGEAYNPPIWGRTARRIFNEISACTTYQRSSRAGPTTRMTVVDTETKDVPIVDRQSVAAAFGAVSASAGNSALALSSEAEVQSYRSAIARKKAAQPEVYQSEVARGISAVDSMVRAAQITDMTPDQIERATQAYNVLLLKSGVDVVNDRDVVSSTASAVAAEGRAEASSFAGASASA